MRNRNWFQILISYWSLDLLSRFFLGDFVHPAIKTKPVYAISSVQCRYDWMMDGIRLASIYRSLPRKHTEQITKRLWVPSKVDLVLYKLQLLRFLLLYNSYITVWLYSLAIVRQFPTSHLILINASFQSPKTGSFNGECKLSN